MEEIKNQIEFCSEGIENPLIEPNKYIDWLLKVAHQESKPVSTVCYTFCDDPYLLEINKQYLQHDYYTDIITFPYNYDPIQTDIIISLDRVADNASQNNITKEKELLRVMVHGLLHMCGYDDQTEEAKSIMREKESFYMELF